MAYQRGRYEEDEGPAYGASASYGAVPDIVQSFVIYLYRHIREKNVYEIHQMYEGSFNKITERMFKQSPWPVVDAIAPFVENDHVFCLLYKELYFRHVFARLTPTLEQRMESWDNYCTLFQVGRQLQNVGALFVGFESQLPHCRRSNATSQKSALVLLLGTFLETLK